MVGWTAGRKEGSVPLTCRGSALGRVQPRSPQNMPRTEVPPGPAPPLQPNTTSKAPHSPGSRAHPAPGPEPAARPHELGNEGLSPSSELLICGRTRGHPLPTPPPFWSGLAGPRPGASSSSVGPHHCVCHLSRDHLPSPDTHGSGHPAGSPHKEQVPSPCQARTCTYTLAHVDVHTHACRDGHARAHTHSRAH